MSSDEEDIVLDPFIGTGTAAIASKKLGRKFIGIDVDAKYVEITNKKLVETLPTIVNNCYVSDFLGNVITIRDKDWDKIKSAFVIPKNPLELEKREIYFLQRNNRTIKYDSVDDAQKDLFPMCKEKE